MSADDPASIAQWGETRRWFEKAMEDRRMAAIALGADPPLLDPSGFHCQQAAEKLLKGLLVAAALTIPKTHDLERLASLVMPAYPQLAGLVDRLTSLTPWGTATRYPDLDTELGLTAEDISEAPTSIDALYDAAEAFDPTPGGRASGD